MGNGAPGGLLSVKVPPAARRKLISVPSLLCSTNRPDFSSTVNEACSGPYSPMRDFHGRGMSAGLWPGKANGAICAKPDAVKKEMGSAKRVMEKMREETFERCLKQREICSIERRT